ncbi:hypothetical protein HDU82_003968, partial [Entophlyctis luteolus]
AAKVHEIGQLDHTAPAAEAESSHGSAEPSLFDTQAPWEPVENPSKIREWTPTHLAFTKSSKIPRTPPANAQPALLSLRGTESSFVQKTSSIAFVKEIPS